MRAVSTVVDVTVFLLLVGGAIATLVGGTGAIPAEGGNPSGNGNPAAEDARLLATNTATVNYSLAPATRSPSDDRTFHRTGGSAFERTAHGTLASLLADAAVAAAAVEERRLSHASEEFERTLESTVRERLDRRGVRTNVEAVWKPYPGAPLSGRITIGDSPPRDADVHAATLQVDSGIPASQERAGRGARTAGYQGVARVVADDVVRGLFPPRETRLALRGDAPVDALTAQRYRRTAELIGATPHGIDEGNVTESNDRLATALARRLEADIVEQYDSPEAAADAVDTETVHITVRTWSP